MNLFIEQFEDLVLQQGITDEQESELIDHIFNESVGTTVDEFITANLTSDSAADFLSCQPNPFNSLIDFIDLPAELAISNLPEPAGLAYHLAYSDTEYGAKLLNELLYYQSQGRF